MSDDHLDDLLRDSLVNDARRRKQLADGRRACKALAQQDNAYESLRNCARDLLDKELNRPSTLDEYLVLFAQRVAELYIVLTPDARARLQSLDSLAGAEQAALDVLLSGDADSVLSHLRKIGQSPSLLKTVTNWLRYDLENILDDVEIDDHPSERTADEPPANPNLMADGEIVGEQIRLNGALYNLSPGLLALLSYLLQHNGATEEEVIRHCGFRDASHLHKRLKDLRDKLKALLRRAPKELRFKTEARCVSCTWHPRQ